MIAIKDIAWAAGIYEGEGNFSGNHVIIAQKDTWLLHKLIEIFKFGTITPHGDSCHGWVIAGANARSFLLTIFPLLSPRRKNDILKHKIFFIDSKFKQRSICGKGHDLSGDNIRRKYSPKTRKFYNTCLICQTDRRRNQTQHALRVKQLSRMS